MKRVKRFGVVAVALILVFTTACGDDDEGDGAADTTSTTEAPSTTLDPAATAEAEAEITTTVQTLFNGATPLDERVQFLEDGEELKALVEEQFSILGEQARNTTAQVKTIKLLDAESAEFTFDVLLAGAPVVPNYPGLAVLVDDQWKVSRITLCDLLRLANNQPRECQNLSE